jgi:hypothetical protein
VEKLWKTCGKTLIISRLARMLGLDYIA